MSRMPRSFGVFVFALVIVLGLVIWMILPRTSNEGYIPEQPIPFSHKLHAGQYKMDCRYCHTSAYKSAHAGVPALSTCMGCHTVVKAESPWIQQIQKAYAEGKPIEWVRIHELPDHAHFNHKRHLAKGVTCQTCHGNVQDMEKVYQAQPLTMGWCLNCHRGFDAPKNILKSTYPDQKDPVGPVAPFGCNTCHY
jgi:hypothetical protein